jgi:LysR family hydrogen peroxide-inducible transcriptional activator
MKLVQLEYALALKKYGSYSRAAQAVGISQPAMSIQIKNLEGAVGINLFDRSQKKVAPTPEGELFLERAQLLVLQARQLRDYALELSEEYTGELKIGIIPTLAPYLLPLFIEELHEQFSRLQVHVKEAITEEIVQGIKSGELDGGIISTPIGSKVQFTTKPLFYEGFLLFVSEQHPLYTKEQVAVRDIPLKDLWLLREGNCFRDQVNNICELANQEESKQLFYFESNSIESLCRIVEHKGGITFLPELTSLHVNSEREEMIKKLAGPRQVREISMIHLPRHVREEHMDQLAEVIRNSVPKNMLSEGDYGPIPTNIDL